MIGAILLGPPFAGESRESSIERCCSQQWFLPFTATALLLVQLSSCFLDYVGPLELENERLGKEKIRVPSILDVVQLSTKYRKY